MARKNKQMQNHTLTHSKPAALNYSAENLLLLKATNLWQDVHTIKFP